MKYIFKNFEYDFGEVTISNRKLYFLGKIEQLRNDLLYGEFVTGNSEVDPSNAFQENLIDEYLSDFFDGNEINMEYIDRIIINENAERMFDSIYSKITEALIDCIKDNLEEISEEDKSQDLIDELGWLEERYHSKAIHTVITEEFVEDRLNAIFCAEKLIEKLAGTDSSRQVRPNMTVLTNPAVNDNKAWLVVSAAKENINLSDLVESIGANIETISYDDLYEIYGCAVDCQTPESKLISYGQFKDVTRKMDEKIDCFSEDIKDKIRNRMQEIDRNLPLDELLKTHVQYDSNKQSQKNNQNINQDR